MSLFVMLPLLLFSGDTGWVINGGSLGNVDLATGTVNQDVLTLGSVPNHILLHEDFLYVVCSGSDSEALQRVDPVTLDIDNLSIGTSWNCWSSVTLDSDRIAVSAALADKVVIVNTDTFSIENEIAGIGPNPEGMCVLGDSLYVACGGWGSNNNLVVVDLVSESVVDTVEVGTNCQDVVWDGSDELFIVCSGTYGSGDGSIYAVDSENLQVTGSMTVGGFPGTICVRGDYVYAGDPYGSGVYRVDAETHDILNDSSDPLASGGAGFAVDQGDYLYVSDVLEGYVDVYDNSLALIGQYSFSSPAALAVSGTYTGIAGDVEEMPGRLLLSPCPAAGDVLVSGAEPFSEVLVMDISGRVVSRRTSDIFGEADIDVSDLQSGVYLVSSGQIASQLVVTGIR